MNASPTLPRAARRQVLLATVLALVSAVLALLLVVLPAEYGIDPVGSGEALGLLALAEPERDALETAAAAYRSDTVTFELQPFESVEYKYRLQAGQTLVFTWRATGEVVSELHAEPDAAPVGFAESFHKVRHTGHSGSYRAAFSGWHGWFWENRTAEVVQVTLEAAGFYTAARTYRGGHVWETDMTGAGGPGGRP